MYLSPVIPELSIWPLCASVVSVLLLVLIYVLRVRTVVNYRRAADHERADLPDSAYEPASVIIFSQGDADNLAEMLRVVLAQDYPTVFEVIVVNDGESADVRDTVSMLRATHNNLYLTFTPEGVVNLSRKKLALTLGIKAARYNTVVLTTTAAEIGSNLWLRRMMTPFAAARKTEVVLGYAYIDPDEDEAFGKRRRAFDHVADSVRWLSAAIAGKPFRGTEYNIAYRRDVFMRNKGFARSLNLCYGDDDIFVSEIANANNTEVELSEDSLVRLRHGNHPRLSRERNFRRMFTERHIRRRPRFLFPLTGWLQIIAILAAVAGAWFAYPNLIGVVAGLIVVLLIILVDILFWRKAMIALKSRRMLLTLPWLSIGYPLRRMYRCIKAPFSKQKKYTWD